MSLINFSLAFQSIQVLLCIMYHVSILHALDTFNIFPFEAAYHPAQIIYQYYLINRGWAWLVTYRFGFYHKPRVPSIGL